MSVPTPPNRAPNLPAAAVRGLALTVLGIIGEIVVAVALPGGESNAAGGLVILAVLAVPAAAWARRDALDPGRGRRWSVPQTWAVATAIVVVLATIATQVRHPGDVVASLVGVSLVAAIGILVPASIAGRPRR